jgi:hypothetical protein
LVGQLRNTAYSVAQFGTLDDYGFVVVARQHRLIIRELPSENA